MDVVDAEWGKQLSMGRIYQSAIAVMLLHNKSPQSQWLRTAMSILSFSRGLDDLDGFVQSRSDQSLFFSGKEERD